MSERRPGSVARRLGTVILLAVLGAYRLVVSPWLRPACRFVPSCSEYAGEAVERYGPLGGLRRAGARLLRCHPLHPGGVDLVD